MSEIVDLTKGFYRRTYGGFVTSRKMCSLPLATEAIFWRINAVADDFGNLLADPLLFRNAIAGYREDLSVKDVERMVGELARVGLVRWYHIGQDRYLHINGFLDRQPAASRNGKRMQRYPREPDATANDGGQVQAGATKPAGGDGGEGAKNSGAEPPGFIQWWTEYPSFGNRKKGREKCCRIWKQKKLEPIADKVLATLRRCKASPDWEKQGGQFVPGPQPWLNDTPWLTDPAELASGGSEITETGMTRAPVTDEVIRAALGQG